MERREVIRGLFATAAVSGPLAGLFYASQSPKAPAAPAIVPDDAASDVVDEIEGDSDIALQKDAVELKPAHLENFIDIGPHGSLAKSNRLRSAERHQKDDEITQQATEQKPVAVEKPAPVSEQPVAKQDAAKLLARFRDMAREFGKIFPGSGAPEIEKPQIVKPDIVKPDIAKPDIAKPEIVDEKPDSVPTPTARPPYTPPVIQKKKPVVKQETRVAEVKPAEPKKVETRKKLIVPEKTVEVEKPKFRLQAPSIFRRTPSSIVVYNVHTSEKMTLDFSDIDMDAVNRLYRDFRINKEIPIDKRLIVRDGHIINALRKGGATVREELLVSGYRSPQTNAMLQRTRGGQASNSQHMYGRAADRYFAGVTLSTVHKASVWVAKAEGYGGVGYYPKSNFVHSDVARLRFWGPNA